MTTAAPGRASDRVALVLGGAGMAGLLAVAATRGLAVMAREVRFDVDPALDPTPLAALGPAGSLTLDVLLLLACAAVLAAAAIRRRGADWRLLLLAALPLPVLALHGLDDLGHLWRGATWGAAAVAAAVVAGLDAGRPAHRAAVGVVVALAVPLLARGALQVTVEHADTIALWEQTREAFLRDRGWSPDAPAARIYERRLREARPRGWFTTTNIFAAVMVATALASAGLAVAAGRARAAGGWIGGLALLAVAAAAGVVMSGSKGALLALVVGAVALGGWRWIRRLGPRGRGGLLLAMVAAALAAVLARGTLLPEGFAGDRSLLFRWHYLAAAGRIAVTHAGTGVGPDGFQAAYTLERPIRSPEEVTSAHSVFVDWVCMLGVAGIAWIALVGWLLWRAAVPRGPDDPGAAPGDRAAAGPVVAAVAVAAAATVAIAVEWHVLDPLGLAVRGLGALGMAVVAIAIAGGRGDGAAGLVRWSRAAAAATLVMHAQIEMTFFEPGAIVWALVAVGAAAAGPARRCARAPVVVAAGACVALAAALLVVGAAPAHRQQRLVHAAAAALVPFPAAPAARAAARRAAAARLDDAHAALPTNVRPAEAGVRQRLLAAEAARDPAALAAAADRAADLAGRVPRGSTINLAVGALLATGLADDPARRDRALDLAGRLTRLDPKGVFAWRRLGDVRWAAGDRGGAAAAYRRALEIDRQLELDPLKQLAAPDRRTLEERIAAAEAS